MCHLSTTVVIMTACIENATSKNALDAFEQWYDSKDEETQMLIDEISESTSIVESEDFDSFIDQLKSCMDITTAEQFCDSFSGEHDGIGERVTSEFTEQLVDDLGMMAEVPEWLVSNVDWSGVWYGSLRYDYYDLEFQGRTYFMNRHLG